MLGIQRNKVYLSAYDSAWKQEAADTIVNLKNVLGTFAVDIQHIGSTAVFGMSAVPVIDIAVGVRFLEDVNKFIPELADIGVYHVPEKDNARRMFFYSGDLENDIVTHNIHFVEYMDERWQGFMNFRKYLSAKDSHREEYTKIKEAAYLKHPSSIDHYNASKAEYIRNVVRKTSTRNIYLDFKLCRIWF